MKVARIRNEKPQKKVLIYICPECQQARGGMVKVKEGLYVHMDCLLRWNQRNPESRQKQLNILSTRGMAENYKKGEGDGKH